MSNRMKKKSGALKYLILIILVVVLAIVFYMTKQDNNIDNPSGTNQPSNSASPSQQPSQQPSEQPSQQPSEQPSGSSPSDPSSGTISGGGDIVNVDNYVLYDTYVIASEQTQYSQSGYKYFIVRSYTEYEKYINQNLKSPFEDSYVSNYKSLNEETLSTIKNNIDKDFFKSNCLIFIVDYGTKEINASITNIQISDNTVSLNIDRTIASENSSKYNTYIVPIQSSDIKSVSISYIR